MTQLYKTHRRTLLRCVLVAAVIVLAGIIQQQIVAAAGLTDRSPSKANSSPQNDHAHYVRKNSTIGDAKLDLWGYWNGDSGSKYFKLYYNAGGDQVCDIAGSAGSEVAKVTVSVGSATSTYYIRAKQICTSNKTSEHTNKPGKVSTNQFYGRYPLPAKPRKDASGLYKARIQVQFAGDAKNGAYVREFVTNNGSYIGQRGQAGLSDEQARQNTKFPILSLVKGANHSSSISVPFGMPCGASASEGQGALIPLYDADNGPTFNWKVRMRVKDTTTGKYVKFIKGSGHGGTFDLNDTRFTPGSGEKHETSAKINMVPNHHYALEVTGIDGGAKPNNYVAIGLPFDSIYGVVNCSYTLAPQTVLDTDRVEPGQKVAITSTVKKNGAAPAVWTTPTIWRVAKMEFDDDASIASLEQKTADFNDHSPCDTPAYKGTNRISCTTSWSSSPPSDRSGSKKYTFTGASTYETLHYTATAADIGKRICFVTSVNDPRDLGHRVASQSWRHSNNLKCILVAKPPIKPMVQLWGYDGRFGGKSVMSLTKSDSKNYGSWSEYGALSEKRNFNLASASGLEGGSASAAQSSWSHLTFANAGNPCSSSGTFGCYGGVTYPSAMITALRARCASASGNVTQTVMDDKKIICVNGTAHVNGDITYPAASTASPSKLPQFIIIANDIVVKDTVKKIDAWLIATPKLDGTGGRISTCSAVHDGSNYFPAFTDNSVNLTKGDACRHLLKVTGPVVADSLYLYRTRNPGSSGAPAERFDLRADAFLWAYAGGGGSSSSVAQTVSVRELPPRF